MSSVLKFSLNHPSLQCRLARIVNPLHRRKSSLGLWHNDLSTEIKLNIEKHWKDEVLYQPTKKHGKEIFYVLPMFPYPSGNLHMGHVRVYSISDTVARCQNLSGKNVIHPMGWDAFGLPAENAAIERNIAPEQWTHSNIETMKSQLQQLAFNFDWDREISTCDPGYYKWTQFIFLKLFEKGLAYQNEAIVNWDPVDKTVLADEQVDDCGCSWRSGAKVENKFLKQWFIKTTEFAKNLYDGLNNKELENWKDIINLQKHWIGECNGVLVSFEINIENTSKIINVWTSDPFKFLHGSFLTVKSDHAVLHNMGNKTQLVLTAMNPITKRAIPVLVTDDAPYAEGQDVYIACPGTHKEDMKLAESLNVSTSARKINIDTKVDNNKVIDLARKNHVGGYFVSSKLKDWLISRQRYWGTPIPIIHCKNCGAVPVPYNDLPVHLPKILDFRSGIQTLKEEEDWVNCTCPQCQSPAKRETDTMDTFVDSSWYYYRFLDPNNPNLPFDKNNIMGKTPVNMYIGGKEHAVLHLYYARFMAHFLHSLGWTSQPEPFKKLIVQGMVMGQSYKTKSGKYLPPDQVYKDGKVYKEKESNEPVHVQWEKMSKSKYNGENPGKLLSEYGCDTTRLFMLADVPPATSRNWSDTTFPGVLNWQHRLWVTMRYFLKHRSELFNEPDTLSEQDFKAAETKLSESRNYFIATTTFHFMHTQKLSVGISRLQGLTNALRNNVPAEVVSKSAQFELALAQLVVMLSTAAPHFCAELWAGLQAAPHRTAHHTIDWTKGVHQQSWPKVDDDFPLSFLCKVDGKDTCDLKIKSLDLSTMSEADAVKIMLEQEPVKKRLTRGLSKTKYELYPGCRAILHLFVNRGKQVEKVAVMK